MRVSPEFQKLVDGHGLTTACILYRIPDFQSVLQLYVWQEYDMFPTFPELQRFLSFWQRELHGPLHSVRVGHNKLFRPAQVRRVNGEFLLR